jgi:methylenetetrahydrofolate dehydrogenase (NADP+)/methenyltetrahydrofolate cyclohydrolase
MRKDATVTIAHSKTRDLPGLCREADLLVAAIGRPGFVTGGFVKEGAVLVDVGINRVTSRGDVAKFFPGDAARMAAFERKGSTLVGDCDPATAFPRSSRYTPVPGGVGPLTIAMLLRNTLELCRMRRAG